MRFEKTYNYTTVLIDIALRTRLLYTVQYTVLLIESAVFSIDVETSQNNRMNISCLSNYAIQKNKTA